MTYQVAFRGIDGMVIASDTREYLEGGGNRTISKIQIDPSAQFAWAYAGQQFSSLVASSLREGFASGTLTSGEDVSRSIRELSTSVLPDIAFDQKPRSTILWLDGRARKIYRSELLPKNLSIPTEGRMWTAGFMSLIASLIPEHFVDESMTVDQLAVIAAYTIWLANKMEPSLIDGLELAIYRDSKGKFEFLDSGEYTRKAEFMDNRIKSSLLLEIADK